MPASQASNQMTPWQPYAGITVTVPNDSAIHQIYALMKAVNPLAPIHCKYLVIQNDPILSTANVFIGEGPTDSQGASNPSVLTATNKAAVIMAGSSETFGGWWDDYNNIARYYALNDGTGTGVVKLNIQAVRG